MTEQYITAYSIAGVGLRQYTPWEQEISEEFIPFVKESDAECDYEVKFRIVDKLAEPFGRLAFSNQAFYVYVDENGNSIRYFHNDREDGSAYMTSQMDQERKCVLIECIPENLSRFGTSSKDFFGIGLERLLLGKDALVLHASCVDTPYGGILFSGPSGIGKSTQADLWCKCGQGRLLNGDRPILRKMEDRWRAYGSPYAGSSKCHVNECCGIRAIVLLKRASVCEIRRLSGAEMFRRVFAGMTVNNWDYEYVMKASELTMQLIREVPVYELACTKEQEAVQILQEQLEGGEC